MYVPCVHTHVMYVMYDVMYDVVNALADVPPEI